MRTGILEARQTVWAAGKNIVRVDKISGLEFAQAAQRTWEDNDILVIAEPGGAAQITVDRHIRVRQGGGWIEQEFRPDDSELIAQIVSTSGTTGPPKAMAHSRRAISDVVRRLLEAMEMDQTVREYVGVPITFSFGLGRVRAVAAAGGACYLPELFRPDEIAEMLQRNEINALSAVPTMLRVLLANPSIIGTAGPKLKWLEIGSQYMSADEKRAIRELFPRACILQHYGLTEASRSTFLRIDAEDDDVLESVGRPFGKTRVRIGAGRRIEVSGPHLASGRVVDGELNLISDNGWLRTADLGELRGAHLFYLGRADDVVNLSGIKVSVEHLERELARDLPANFPFAIVALPDALRGQRLGLGCATADLEPLKRAAAAALERLGLGPADLSIAHVDEIPRTPTGKVRRSDLADLIGQAALADSSPITDHPENDHLAAREREIAGLWQEALGVERVGRNDTFFDLGGDSLSAVTVTLRAEQLGLPAELIQRMFAGATVAEIAAGLGHGNVHQTQQHPRAVCADALNATRGLLVLAIIASHWGPYFAERLGEPGGFLWRALGPLLRIGTPGFAMVYGMGLGFFYLKQLESGDDRLRRRIRSNTLLLLCGVGLIAVAEAWRLVVTGIGFGPRWPEHLFYGVLLFYAIMVPTSLFWLRLVQRRRDRIFSSLVLGACALGSHMAAASLAPADQFTGWVSLGWHMVVAPYAYPRLLGAAALGLAAALWIEELPLTGPGATRLAKVSVGLVAFGGFLVAAMPGGWSANAGALPSFAAFAGAVLLLYFAFVRLLARGSRPYAAKIAIVCGLLAFPMFIGHGVVIPARDILQAYGIPDFPALLLPVSAFLVAMIWLGRRIYRVYFGAGEKLARP
jgi:acyl-CoA synthetase (AMP-forming)/AMP-acid ligase II